MSGASYHFWLFVVGVLRGLLHFVVDESLPLEEVLPALLLILHLLLLLSLCVTFLHFLDETENLLTFYLLRVEVVRLADIEMTCEVFIGKCLKQAALNVYVVVEPFIRFALKVVNDRDLGRVELEHQLDGNRGHEGAAEGQLCEVDELLNVSGPGVTYFGI